jgi:hypothetical protein
MPGIGHSAQQNKMFPACPQQGSDVALSRRPAIARRRRVLLGSNPICSMPPPFRPIADRPTPRTRQNTSTRITDPEGGRTCVGHR